MLDFIIKYWLEVAFGLVCGAMAYFVKKYIKLHNESEQTHESKLIESIHTEINASIQKIQNDLSTLDTRLFKYIEESKADDRKIADDILSLKKEVLIMEGAYFRSECRKLLKKDHVITQDEFDTITNEHGAYKALGGNHDGDALFEMVKEKHKDNLLENERK